MLKEPIEWLDNIPADLRAMPAWVCWREQLVNGRMTKVPYVAGEQYKAATNRADTWRTFDDATAALQKYPERYHGIGIVARGDIVGVDIDDCVDDGQPTDEAREIIERFNSYTEISPSGEGIRIFCRGAKNSDRCRNGKIEIYDHSSPRYLTVTGNHCRVTPKTIEHRQEAINWLVGKYLSNAEKLHGKGVVLQMQPAIRQTCTLGELGQRIEENRDAVLRDLLSGNWQAHFASQSEADLSAASRLYWYLGNRELVDEAIRASDLYRQKWERDDYRERTLDTAEASFREANGIGPDEPIKPATTKAPRLLRWREVEEIAAGQNEDWFLNNWLEFGSLGVFTGLPFSGKSSITTDIIACSCRGVPFAGLPVRQCPILIIDLENKERILVRRVRASLEGDRGKIDDLVFVADRHLLPLPLGLPTLAEMVGEVKTSTGSDKLAIVIDTLRSAYPGKSTNEEKDMAAVLYPLQRFALQQNAAVLLLHHNAKLSDAYSGTTAIAGASDYLWGWHSNKETGIGTLTLDGTRGDQHAPITFRFMDGRNVPSTKEGYYFDKIFAWVAENHGGTLGGLMEHLGGDKGGKKREYIDSLLDQLVATGKLVITQSKTNKKSKIVSLGKS